MPGYLGGVLRVRGLLDKALMGIGSFLESERAIFCDFLPLRCLCGLTRPLVTNTSCDMLTEIYRFGESLNADIFCLAFEGNNPAEETVNTHLPQPHGAPAVGLRGAAHLLGSQGRLSAPVPVQVLFLSLFH